MATAQPKKFILRAFIIDNPTLSEPDSGILNLLQIVLTNESIAANRRLTLNADEPDIDLLANYTWATNHSFLFGMMLRVIPADSGGLLNKELFEQPIITMDQVSSGSPEKIQYKSHFYLAINNNYLVTTLPGNYTVERIQTYINWLLEPVRGERYFNFTEMTKLPDDLPLSQIKDIQFVGGGNVVTSRPIEKDYNFLSVKLQDLTYNVLDSLFGDSGSLEAIKENQLIEARLFLKVKKKPKSMAQEEFQRVMGAIATNMANDNGILLRTKDGNKYTGAEIKVKKNVSVECVGANRIVEEQLRQEMERFLNEIKNQTNA